MYAYVRQQFALYDTCDIVSIYTVYAHISMHHVVCVTLAYIIEL